MRYEDFVTRPQAELRALARFCRLRLDGAADARIAAAAGTLDLGARNEAWKRRFGPDEQERLLEIIGPTMRAGGYDV